MLLFFIAACFSAEAQQGDFFDISKHLQKKQTEWIKNAESQRLKLPFQKNNLNQYQLFAPVSRKNYMRPNGDHVIKMPGYNIN